MLSNRIDNLLFAYFERSRREYVRTLRSVKLRGGLSIAEIQTIRDMVPEVHAETILRQLATIR